MKLLRQFATQQAQAPVQIAKQLQTANRATAERSVHTVKGVAANLDKACRENAGPARVVEQVARTRSINA